MASELSFSPIASQFGTPSMGCLSPYLGLTRFAFTTIAGWGGKHRDHVPCVIGTQQWKELHERVMTQTHYLLFKRESPSVYSAIILSAAVSPIRYATAWVCALDRCSKHKCQIRGVDRYTLATKALHSCLPP